MTDPTTEGLRERKKRKRRRAIEEAALELFDRQGFHNTTIEQICDVLDISPRTFSRYYPRKEDVLFAERRRDHERFRRALTKHPTTQPLPKAIAEAAHATISTGTPKEVLRVRARVLAASPQLWPHNLEYYHDASVIIADHISCQRHTDPESDLDAQLAGMCYASGLVMAHRQWANDNFDSDLLAIIESMFELIADGFNSIQTHDLAQVIHPSARS